MIIRTNYEDTVKLLSLLQKVTSTKGITESMKVANIYIKDETINIGSTDGRLFCLTNIEGEYELGETKEENSHFAINIKEILDVLDRFRTLQRTKVEILEFYIQERGIILTVRETAKKEDIPNAHLYTEANKFYIQREDISKIFFKEIPEMQVSIGAKEAESNDLYKYTIYSYPLLTTPKDIMYLNFKKEGIYSIIGNHYGLLMDNTLPEEFSGFSLTPYVVGFLREVMTEEDKFKFTREDIWGPDASGGKQIVGVVLTLKIGKYIVKIKTADKTEVEIPQPFLPKSDVEVVIDKFYLLDVLKRVDTYDTLYISVDSRQDGGEMVINTHKSQSKIPIKSFKGEGKYKFAVHPAHLSNIIFSHMTKTLSGDQMDDLTLGFRECTDKKNVELTCSDKTKEWVTKYPRAPQRELSESIF